jgi:hypothetical protein
MAGPSNKLQGFFVPKERGPQNDRGPAFSSPNTDIWLHSFVHTARRES